MDAAAEVGRNPLSKHHIQPKYGDEQADVGGDCRTLLARSNSQARTGTDKKIIFPVQLTTRKIGNLTRLVLTLVIGEYHSYIHTYSIPYNRFRFTNQYCTTSGIGYRVK